MFNRNRRRRYWQAFGDAFAAVGSANTEYMIDEYFFPNKRQKMAPIHGPRNRQPIPFSSFKEALPFASNTTVVKFRANPPLRRTLKGSVEYKDYWNYEVEWENSTKKFTTLVNIGTFDQYVNNNNHPNQGPFSSRRWFDLQPNQGQVAGNFVPAKTAPNADWIGVSNCYIIYDFINLTNLPCWCRITWYRAMEDTTVSILNAYRDSTLNNKLFTTDFTTNPLIVVDPLTEGNELVLGYSAPTVNEPEKLEVTPYTNLSSRKECRFKWKKLASRSWTMSGGGTQQVANIGQVNCFQRFQTISDEAGIYYKGSVVCILETQGLASHLKIDVPDPNPNGQPLVDAPSLAAGKLGIIVSRKLNIKAMTPTVNRYDSTFIGIGSLPYRGVTVQNEVIRDNDMEVGDGIDVDP